MFDESEELQQDGPLARLLAHYVQIGLKDREAWQDRVMHLQGIDARELVKLHGQLLAFGWVEQNTGLTPVLKPEVAASCYRITSAGLRAMRGSRAQWN
jgi:hypothetical protein